MASQGETGTSMMPIGMSSQIDLASPDIAMGFDMHSCGDSSSESRSPEVPTARASDRESRIIAEKHRRSQYNTQIALMTTLLTDIVHSQRKVDKTSVLRLAANKLRNEHVFGDTISCPHIECWSPAFAKYFELFGSVMIGVTCRGRIFIVSPNVQEKLGHCNIDLLGQDFYNYVHPDDKHILHQHIYPIELQTRCDKSLFEHHHNFNIRVRKAGARSDPPRYEQCRVDGVLRRSDRATEEVVQDEKLIRRPRVRQHNRTFSSSGNDYVFIGMIHVVQNSMPARILPPTAYSEYWTRHLIDGRIVQCEQNISLAAGYMTEEVTGTSAFVFMHKDDVRWVICVLRQMYDQSREFGESYYRLMSRSGEFIYMRTRGFLEIDKDNKKVQSFVCVNSVISEDYGRRMMEEMKRKYSVIVDMDRLESQKLAAINEASVEHPKRIERIVMHLVEPPASETEELKLVPPSKENIISAIKNSERVVKETGVIFDSRKRKKEDYDDDDNDSHEQLKKHSAILDISKPLNS